VEMQIRMLHSGGKKAPRHNGHNGQAPEKRRQQPARQSGGSREPYQGNKGRGWANSLRGSGGEAPAPPRRSEPRRSEPRRPAGGDRRHSGVGQRQEAERRRSESHSPSGRLTASTFASRAKQSEASIAEEARQRAGSRARDSRTPSRSRANSVSREPARRRSSSKPRGGQQQPQRSYGGFADNDDDGLEDVPDPFLAYKSFDKFKQSQDSYGGHQVETRSERSKSKVSSSDSSALKKISESFASSKISDSSYSSSKLSSSGQVEGILENFDYKFSNSKLSDSRNSGVFSSSTPKYVETSSSSSYLSRTASSSMFSDSGYGGLSKRNSGAFSSALDSSFSSSRTSPESVDRERLRGAGNKISLGSLKQASVENWESQNSAILRRGASSTYIG